MLNCGSGQQRSVWCSSLAGPSRAWAPSLGCSDPDRAGADAHTQATITFWNSQKEKHHIFILNAYCAQSCVCFSTTVCPSPVPHCCSPRRRRLQWRTGWARVHSPQLCLRWTAPPVTESPVDRIDSWAWSLAGRSDALKDGTEAGRSIKYHWMFSICIDTFRTVSVWLPCWIVAHFANRFSSTLIWHFLSKSTDQFPGRNY